jgi:hypothetical protein
MQTDYSDMSAGLRGMLADAGDNEIITGYSTVAQEFGKGLQVLTGGGVLLPAAVTNIFQGITVMNNNAVQNATGLAGFAIGQAIPILRKGRIWVQSEQAVNPTLAVFWKCVASGFGDFRVDADTANAKDISAFAKWISVTAGAGLAILELNYP